MSFPQCGDIQSERDSCLLLFTVPLHPPLRPCGPLPSASSSNGVMEALCPSASFLANGVMEDSHPLTWHQPPLSLHAPPSLPTMTQHPCPCNPFCSSCALQPRFLLVTGEAKPPALLPSTGRWLATCLLRLPLHPSSALLRRQQESCQGRGNSTAFAAEMKWTAPQVLRGERREGRR